MSFHDFLYVLFSENLRIYDCLYCLLIELHDLVCFVLPFSLLYIFHNSFLKIRNSAEECILSPHQSGSNPSSAT